MTWYEALEGGVPPSLVHKQFESYYKWKSCVLGEPSPITFMTLAPSQRGANWTPMLPNNGHFAARDTGQITEYINRHSDTSYNLGSRVKETMQAKHIRTVFITRVNCLRKVNVLIYLSIFFFLFV